MLLALAATAFLPFVSRLAAGDKPVETPRATRAVAFDAESVESRLRHDVEYLASDDLRGRATGSKGADQAADYIADQFAAAGLKTDLLGKPFQELRLGSRRALGPGNRVELLGAAGKVDAIKPGGDYTPLAWSRSGTFDLPLVFVGYGITAPDKGYDDYAGLDVAGKAVIVLRHEPQAGDAKSPFAGAKNSDHAFVQTKIANAVRHQAAAVIFCTDRHTVAAQRETQKGLEPGAADPDPLLNFQLRGAAPGKPLVLLHCRRAVVDAMLRDAGGPSLDNIEQGIDRTLKPASRELPDRRIRGEVVIRDEGVMLRNVVGVLEGSGDKAEETIVIGAHYDHLGLGGFGSLGGSGQIHNGADDNASGTAVLMEVARQLGRKQLGRRVLFIAFSGEEIGLVGSELYTEQPVVPLKQTVAMINLDMVGRMRGDHLFIHGPETADEFNRLVARLTEKYGLRVHKSLADFAPSDHASFSDRGIPVLHFFTGLHNDYHTPRDDADRLNYPGMRKITDFVTDTVREIAAADKRPTPAKNLGYSGLFDLPEAPRQTFLGIQAAENKDAEGFKVGGVFKRSPAEKAGLRAGDVVIEINGAAVKKNADLMDSIHGKKPGDRVKLLILRDGVRMEVEAVLGSR